MSSTPTSPYSPSLSFSSGNRSPAHQQSHIHLSHSHIGGKHRPSHHGHPHSPSAHHHGTGHHQHPAHSITLSPSGSQKGRERQYQQAHSEARRNPDVMRDGGRFQGGGSVPKDGWDGLRTGKESASGKSTPRSPRMSRSPRSPREEDGGSIFGFNFGIGHSSGRRENRRPSRNDESPSGLPERGSSARNTISPTRQEISPHPARSPTSPSSSYPSTPTRSYSSSSITGAASPPSNRPLFSVIPGPPSRSSSYTSLTGSFSAGSPIISSASAGLVYPASPLTQRRARTMDEPRSNVKHPFDSTETEHSRGGSVPRLGSRSISYLSDGSGTTIMPTDTVYVADTQAEQHPSSSRSSVDRSRETQCSPRARRRPADTPESKTGRRRAAQARHGGHLLEIGETERANAQKSGIGGGLDTAGSGGSGSSKSGKRSPEHEGVREVVQMESQTDAGSDAIENDVVDARQGGRKQERYHEGFSYLVENASEPMPLSEAMGVCGGVQGYDPSDFDPGVADADRMRRVGSPMNVDVIDEVSVPRANSPELSSRGHGSVIGSRPRTKSPLDIESQAEGFEHTHPTSQHIVDQPVDHVKYDFETHRKAHKRRQSKSVGSKDAPVIKNPTRSPKAEKTPDVRTQQVFAYNASTKEEEDHRARLAAACEGLSSLCSQYHGSVYSRMKYGDRGAPVAYCPLTIVAPQHVAEVMAAQAIYEMQLFASSDDSLDSIVSSTYTTATENSFESASLITPSTSMMMSDSPERLRPLDLEVEGGSISGWQEVFVPSQDQHSEQQIQAEHAGVMPSKGDPSLVVPQSLLEEEGLDGTAVEAAIRRTGPTSDDQDSITMRLREAMSASIQPTVLSSTVASSVMASTSVNPTAYAGPAESPARLAAAVKTSSTHPINISTLLPPQVLPWLPQLLDPRPAYQTAEKHLRSKPLLMPASAEVFNKINLADTPGNPVPYQDVEALQSAELGCGIGNMLLSSCPGKKVRLDGPVKGRGAICRDLTSDLLRIKGMGVGCIVCCLDDNELRFLGVPWAEYRATAYATDLSVVRIPMPEGLTPASMTTFDAHIEKVIRKFTLKGVNVLAHCRGGIGRAGLTACAWAVKLGIAGPSPAVEAQLQSMQAEEDFAGDFGPKLTSAERENARVMSTVERVISLTRSRRSVKAIETFEQVNFLASYVAWLRKESGVAEADEMKSLSAGYDY